MTMNEQQQQLVSMDDAAAQAMAVRAQAEIQAALLVAQRFPRHVDKCFAAGLAMAKRPNFADKAIYEREQGKELVGKKWVPKMIEGPSVHLARALQSVWGNIRVTCQVLPSEPGIIHIEAVATDLERNSESRVQDRFRARQFRRASAKTAYREAQPDRVIDLWESLEGNAENDLRIMVMRRMAFIERAAVLKLLPADFVDDIYRACYETCNAAAAGDLAASPDETRRKLVMAFGEQGVTVDMLERHLDHPIEEITPGELTKLRGIYQQIKLGAVERDEYFAPSEIRKSPAQMLNAELASSSPNAGATGSAPVIDWGDLDEETPIDPERAKQ